MDRRLARLPAEGDELQPGASSTGELLILRVDSGLFQYHASTDGPFAYCAEPSAGYTVGG